MTRRSIITLTLLASLVSSRTIASPNHFPPPMPSPETSLTESQYANGTLRANEAANRVKPRLKTQLAKQNLALGSPVFIRIFKQSRELELWVQSKNKSFTRFKTYKIAAMSGNLGPKIRTGDYQAPEGFYFVTKSQLNPQSRFHLSFNLGYPNALDRALGRTGSALMVHGDRVSAGCFAMTDYYIEEIYTICAAALANGQPFFRVHIFPFRLTEENLAQHKNHKSHPFWANLKPGYDHFQTHKTPPNIIVRNKKYLIDQ